MIKNNALMEAFLLGMSYSSLRSVQEELIQGKCEKALSKVNDALRTLDNEVNKRFRTSEAEG